MNKHYSIEKAIHPLSAGLRGEIKALWQGEQAHIADEDGRLAEVRYIARGEGNELVGVCSSTIERGIYNGLSFHSMRVLIASDYRQNLLAFEILAHLCEELQDDFNSTSPSGPAGVSVVIQTPIVAQRGAVACTRTFQFPVNKRPLTFLLSGFSPRGHPEYCCYFPDEGPSAQASLARWSTHTQSLSRSAAIAPVGPGTAQAERERVAVALGLTAGDGAKLEGRHLFTLKANGQLLALCELLPRFVPEINGRLLGMQIRPLQDVGQIDLHACFGRELFAMFNRSGASPPAEGVGLFNIYTEHSQLPPACPVTGFHLHGIDQQGQELRVRYFDGIKVPVPQG